MHAVPVHVGVGVCWRMRGAVRRRRCGGCRANDLRDMDWNPDSNVLDVAVYISGHARGHVYQAIICMCGLLQHVVAHTYIDHACDYGGVDFALYWS